MICFVILHYMAIDETVKCISSIKKKICEEKKIIIVDNNSSNNTGKLLNQIYSEDKEVEVIINKNNEGFAKGNNLGYAYAKEKYNPQFIFILNNDIEIIQDNFMSIVRTIYQEEKFYVLGPDVFSDTYRIHQSPKRLKHFTKEEVRSLYLKLQKENTDHIYFKLKCMIKKIKWLRGKIYRYRNQQLKMDYSIKYYNVPIHGSFLIFSELYITKEDNAFYPATFFYYETEILDFLCNKKNYKVLYDPKIKVLHHQNTSTDLVYRKIIDKTKFAYNCNKQSLKVFLELMEKD